MNPKKSDKDNVDHRRVLETLLAAYMEPAFGSLPKREVDLKFLEALESVGRIPKEPTIYDLVTTLRITRGKARALLYDWELRRSTPDSIREKAIAVLKRPVFENKGKTLSLEIENPLVLEWIREQAKIHRFIADGTFSPTLITMPISGFILIIESILDEAHKKEVRKALVKAGAKDGSFTSVMGSALEHVATKVIGEAGEAVAAQAMSYLTPLFSEVGASVTTEIPKLFGPLFGPKN
jgi:hypothetical protein